MGKMKKAFIYDFLAFLALFCEIMLMFLFMHEPLKELLFFKYLMGVMFLLSSSLLTYLYFKNKDKYVKKAYSTFIFMAVVILIGGLLYILLASLTGIHSCEKIFIREINFTDLYCK